MKLYLIIMDLNKYTYKSINAEEIIDANTFIQASFDKGLEIEPTGLTSPVKDYIALYCANEIFISFNTKNKENSILKSFKLTIDLGIQSNMCNYLASIFKEFNRENELLDNIHFFIDVFEKMINKYKNISSSLIIGTEYLEDAYYRIHKKNRLGLLKNSSTFKKEYDEISKTLLAHKLENNLSPRQFKKNNKI